MEIFKQCDKISFCMHLALMKARYFVSIFSLFVFNFGAKNTHLYFQFFMENSIWENRIMQSFSILLKSELELLWQMLSIRHVPLLFVTATMDLLTTYYYQPSGEILHTSIIVMRLSNSPLHYFLLC